MSPGLPGLAISYLLYAALGVASFVRLDGHKKLPNRVLVSSVIALSGLFIMAGLAWWKQLGVPLIFLLTQPFLLMSVLLILALVRRRLKRRDGTIPPMGFNGSLDDAQRVE